MQRVSDETRDSHNGRRARSRWTGPATEGSVLVLLVVPLLVLVLGVLFILFVFELLVLLVLGVLLLVPLLVVLGVLLVLEVLLLRSPSRQASASSTGPRPLRPRPPRGAP